MRILFHGPGTSTYLPEIRLPNTSGLRHSITDRLVDLKDTQSLTSNRGNLVHGEAPARIFQCNRRQSAFANLGTLHRIFGDRLGDLLPRHFDLIVLSAANFISPTRDLTRLRDALNVIGDGVPFMVLGAGMQGSHALSELHPSVQEILDIYNRRAVVFGVRGAQTEAWLHRNGFERAQALGCPSMYVFPQSIMSIDHTAAYRAGASAKILTAGYLTVRKGRHFDRGRQLARAMKGADASYVFQDEFFAYGKLIEEGGSFNDATSTGDRDALNRLLGQAAGVPLNMRNYYYFSETAAWRQVALNHDIYIGDRFHGGVAALQVGRPGIFLAQDNRVAELTDFFDLPRMTLDELEAEGIEHAIRYRVTAETVARTKATYRIRFQRFADTMKSHGVKLHSSL